MKLTSFIFTLVFIPFLTTTTCYGMWICSEPSEPSIPNGYYAESYQMDRVKREVEDYLEEVEEYIECLKRNIQEASSSAEDAIDEWNSAVRNYNDK